MMKNILAFAMVLVMLLSCVACSNTNNTDSTDGSKPSASGSSSPLPGPKHPLPSELPMEMRPLVHQAGMPETWEIEAKPFDHNDPRKKYLEEKYGVTAYCVADPTASGPYTIFELEGYEGRFQLFSKEDLIAMGTPEENIPADYSDNAYYTVAYAEIYEYFAQAAKKCGVTVDRMIIQARNGNINPYDPDRSFTDCLASINNPKMKWFDIRFYGDFGNGNNAVEKLLTELDKLDFKGRIQFYKVIQDISNLTNDDLMEYMIYNDYVQFYETQHIN